MAALIDTPEAANRLARAIASDLSLYNEAKIKEGIENDTFFSVLQEEIAEGRAHYESRVPRGRSQKSAGSRPPPAASGWTSSRRRGFPISPAHGCNSSSLPVSSM